MSHIKRQTERMFASRNGIHLKTHFKHISTTTHYEDIINKAAFIVRSVFIKEMHPRIY